MAEQPLIFNPRDQQARRAVLSVNIESNSGHFWSHICLESTLAQPAEPQEFACAFHHITLICSPWQGEYYTNGSWRGYPEQAGMICVTPALMPFQIRWFTAVASLMLTVDPVLLDSLAKETSRSKGYELQHHIYPAGDALICQTILALHQDLQQGHPLGVIYGDTLSMSLAAHLLLHYSSDRPAFAVPPKGLSHRQLKIVLDYIEANLDQSLHLKDIAATVYLSEYYFCRLFRQSMGCPLHQYIRQQRIKRAKLLLKDPRLSLTDIALQCGFANQSHFSRLFRQSTQMTPKAYRCLFI